LKKWLLTLKLIIFEGLKSGNHGGHRRLIEFVVCYTVGIRTYQVLNKMSIIRNAYLNLTVTQGTPAHDLMKIHDPEGVITNLKDITQKMLHSEFALTFIFYWYFCKFSVSCFGHESNRLQLISTPIPRLAKHTRFTVTGTLLLQLRIVKSHAMSLISCVKHTKYTNIWKKKI